MKKVLIPIALLALSVAANAQTVLDVMNSILLSRTTSTTILTLTASQGDGGTLKLVKNSGSTISLTTTWTSASGSISDQSSVMRASGTVALTKAISYGDTTCLIGVNPTAASIAMGSIPAIPANGIGWSCATNITGGAQTTPVSGTAVWP